MINPAYRYFGLIAIFLLTGCAGSVVSSQAQRSSSGGFYLDDGPLEGVTDAQISSIEEPTPRALPLHKGATKPYSVFGTAYTPMTKVVPFKQKGRATWYGKKYHGKPTSTGEIFDSLSITAAHTSLPLPSFVRIKNLENGKSIIAKVNDRGPFFRGRILDVSYAAARKLGFARQGSALVEIESIIP